VLLSFIAWQSPVFLCWVVIVLSCPSLQVNVPAAVTGLAWAGSSLLCAVPGGYYVLRPTGHSTAQHGLASPTAAAAAGTAGGMQYQLTLLADHLTSIRPLLGSIPDLGLGLMAWEDNMVLVTDAAGADTCVWLC
jgi:hypothetical protein